MVDSIVDMHQETVENPADQGSTAIETDKVKVSDSILRYVKKRLGGDLDGDEFDDDIIGEINTALNTLTQLGVGPKKGFVIEGPEETWSQFIGKEKRLFMVKEYLFVCAKIRFDPPSVSYLLSSLQETKRELEFRLNVQVDPKDTFS